MTEASKTIAIVALSAAVLAMGFATRPRPPAPVAGSKVGQKLFPKLDDPLKAKRIKITTFDDAAGEAREFEVAHVGGGWSLPSHQNYPADATDQMAGAATALSGMKVLGEVSSSPKDHELYGVVEPDVTKNQAGQKGIGKLVEMEDDAKNSLARLIIGKEDKSSKSDDEFGGSPSKLRYVRVKNQDQVYRVAMANDKFSTKFENWIETDLLKLNAWDVTQVELRDLSASLVPTNEGLAPSVERRADIDLAFNDKDQKWALEKLTKYVDRKPVEEKLKEGEDLNTTKLNDMKSALDNLKIVDVRRKPEQMIADLKAQTDFVRDERSAMSLASKGFVPAMVNDKIEIFPSNGEVIVGMKDGVEYVLRFGNNAGLESTSDEDEAGDAKSDAKSKADGGDDKADTEKKDDAATDVLRITEKKDAKVNRYVMVTARFNADLLAKPELEPLPEVKTAPEKSEKKDEKKDAAKSDSKDEKSKKDDAAKAEAGKADEKKSEEAQASEEEEDPEVLEQRRAKIEKENSRKQEEYDEQVKKGQDRAKELNARFADWYYVVSDDTFRKIHLGVSDIIKQAPKEDATEDAAAAGPTDPFLKGGPAPAKTAPPAAKKK